MCSISAGMFALIFYKASVADVCVCVLLLCITTRLPAFELYSKAKPFFIPLHLLSSSFGNKQRIFLHTYMHMGYIFH